MEYKIRQLSFADIFDQSLRILVDNAVLLVGLATLYGIPSEALPRGRGWPELMRWAFLLFAAPFPEAALASAAADICLNRDCTVQAALKTAGSIYLAFMGTFLIVECVSLPGIGLLAIATVTKSHIGAAVSGIVAIAGIVLLAISIFFLIRWILYGPIMLVERRFGPAALRRSSALLRGAWWRTFGIFAAVIVVELLPVRIFRVFWSSLPVVGTVLDGLIVSITYAYVSVLVTVYYFDRRCRLEDFDLRYLADQIRADTVQSPRMTQ
jgi:hypothetical protein